MPSAKFVLAFCGLASAAASNSRLRGRNLVDNEFSVSHPDPSVFSYFAEPAEISAGQQGACGYLTAPLSYDPGLDGEGFPTVKVKFCVAFARTQPAPKGVLFLHCGGPSWASGCFNQASPTLGNLTDNYDVLTVDQRGVGDSKPSFDEVCNTDAVGYPAASAAASSVDPDSQESIEGVLDLYRTAIANCWAQPAFNFANPVDGSTIHFLENSGTQALINDMNLVRQAFGQAKLSLYGISYGTAIAGAYATTFPAFADKLILNSPVPPVADGPRFAAGKAYAIQQKDDFMLETCAKLGSGCPIADIETAYPALLGRLPFNFSSWGAAPHAAWLDAVGAGRTTLGDAVDAELARVGPPLVACGPELTRQPPASRSKECQGAVDDFNALAEAAAFATLSATPTVLGLSEVGLPMNDLSSGNNGNRIWDRLKLLTDAAPGSEAEFAAAARQHKLNVAIEQQTRYLYKRGVQLVPGAADLVAAAKQGVQQRRLRARKLDAETETEDGGDGQAALALALPTMENSLLAQSMVDSQDRANHFHSKASLLREWAHVRERNPSKMAMVFWVRIIAPQFTWPMSVPLPSMGSQASGIVIGNLFDPQTPYMWAQQQKSAFPNTAMISGQWLAHSVTSASYGERSAAVCYGAVEKYLLSGDGDGGALDLPTDGITCRAPKPPVSDALQRVVLANANAVAAPEAPAPEAPAEEAPAEEAPADEAPAYEAPADEEGDGAVVPAYSGSHTLRGLRNNK